MSLLIFCCGLCWLAGREECFVGVLECHDFFYSIFTHFYYIYISVIFCHFFITFENYFILLFIYMSIYSLTYFVFSFFELQAFKISMILETWKSGPRFTILFRPIISLSRQIKKKYIYIKLLNFSDQPSQTSSVVAQDSTYISVSVFVSISHC